MNLSAKQRKLLTAFGIPAAILICALALLPALERPSNCGGNSAALNACNTVVICFRLIGSEHGDNTVSVTALSSKERAYFEQIAGLDRLGDARVLVSTSAVNIAELGSNVIVTVCDEPFDNVPRRFFGRALMTHAVAYADGGTRLIPMQEFRKLDLTQFVDVRTIPEKEVEPDAAHELPAAAAVRELRENMNAKPERGAPADNGGR